MRKHTPAAIHHVIEVVTRLTNNKRPSRVTSQRIGVRPFRCEIYFSSVQTKQGPGAGYFDSRWKNNLQRETIYGRVAERFNALVLKTRVANNYREFESHPFRQLASS